MLHICVNSNVEKMPIRKILLSYTLLCLLVSGCKSRSDLSLPDELSGLSNLTIHEGLQSVEELTLSRSVTFNDTSSVLIGSIYATDIDDKGRVYIADGQKSNMGIYVFDANGTFVDRIGRSGRGPGEFQGLYDIEIFNNKLYVLDGNLLRIQIFSTDTYELLQSIALDPEKWAVNDGKSMTFPERLRVRNDSTMLVIFNNYTFDMDRWLYYLLDTNGDVIEGPIITHDYIKHLKTADGSFTIFDPFGGRGMMGFTSDNEIITAWSEHLLFKIYDSEGNYLRSFYHPFTNSTLSRDEALSYIDQPNFRSALKNEGIPDQWRAFEQLVVDDNDQLWISTLTDDKSVYNWWVLDKKGALRSTFEWPRTNRIIHIKNKSLYVIESSPDDGTKQVVRYTIV